jgi:hypothetical protein
LKAATARISRTTIRLSPYATWNETHFLPTNLRSTLSPPQSRPLLTHSPCGLHHELPRRLVWLFRVGTLLHPPFPFVFRDLKRLKAFMPHVLHLEFDRRPHRNMTPYATSMTPSPSRKPSSVVGPRTFFSPSIHALLLKLLYSGGC